MFKIFQKQFAPFLHLCIDKISWKRNAKRDLNSLILQHFFQNVSTMTTTIIATWEKENEITLSLVASPLPGSNPAI